MLGESEGCRLCRYVPDYTVFDLETTGVSPGWDALIEISALSVRGGTVQREYTTLVNPGRHIPEGATRVNGITDEMVKDAPSLGEVFPGFLEFIGDDILVGHNIHSFDMKFIFRDSRKCCGKIPCNDYVDTLYLARNCLPDLRHHRLTDLADYYGISTAGAHRALADCYMNQQVFERLHRQIAEKNSGAGGIRVCPQCGQVLVRRRGRYGEFYGCGGYPRCRYTEKA